MDKHRHTLKACLLVTMLLHAFLAAAAWHVAFCFANVAFLEPISSTPLNGSLRNFNRWCVSAGNRKPRRDVLGIASTPTKIGGSKTSSMLLYMWYEMEICFPRHLLVVVGGGYHIGLPLGMLAFLVCFSHLLCWLWVTTDIIWYKQRSWIHQGDAACSIQPKLRYIHVRWIWRFPLLL